MDVIHLFYEQQTTPLRLLFKLDMKQKNRSYKENWVLDV